jgi:hypothetical protein
MAGPLSTYALRASADKPRDPPYELRRWL